MGTGGVLEHIFFSTCGSVHSDMVSSDVPDSVAIVARCARAIETLLLFPIQLDRHRQYLKDGISNAASKEHVPVSQTSRAN